MYPYRLFITHSSEDTKLADLVEKQLRTIGYEPIRASADLTPGRDFLTGIKKYIRHAHALVPILTNYSSSRPWVNHETGFALGSGVPVLPICINAKPEGLTESQHALMFDSEEDFVNRLEKVLTTDTVEGMFGTGHSPSGPIFECAESPDDRNRVLVEYLAGCRDFGFGTVRQCAAFSSFSIPDKDPIDPAWDARDGELTPRSKDAKKLLREERQMIEENARKSNIDLIIKPKVRATEHGTDATIARLSEVRAFLESMAKFEDRIRVAIWPDDKKIYENITIVGDWFAAIAVVPFAGESYRNTIFTRHAATVLKQIQEFDSRMNSLLSMQQGPPHESRRYAINVLDDILADLNASR
jgi:hypothetical protein